MSIKGIDNILEHYGTKGMKWGIRKKSGKGSAKSGQKGKAKQAESEKRTSTKKYKKSAARKLSDERLKKRVNRLNMERQYKDLVSKQKPKSKVSRGAKTVGNMIANAGAKAVRKQVVEPIVSDLVKKGIGNRVQARRG